MANRYDPPPIYQADPVANAASRDQFLGGANSPGMPPKAGEMSPEERHQLRQRFGVMGRGNEPERFREALKKYRPGFTESELPQAGVSPNLGEAMSQKGQAAQQAQAVEDIEMDDPKFKVTTTQKSDGTTTEVTDLGDEGKITETKKDGKVVSRKVVDNDPTRSYREPPGQSPEPEPSIPMMGEPRPIPKPSGGRASDAKAMTMAIAGDPYASGFSGMSKGPGASGELVASDFMPFMPRRQEGLSPRKLDDLDALRKRFGMEDPASPEARSRRTFTPPERTLSNMDWTPSKKLLDYVYGGNLAAGSKDPLVGEFNREFATFKANVAADKARGGGKGRSHLKQIKDLDDLRKSLSLDPNEQMKHRLNQAKLGKSILENMSKAEKIKYDRDMRTVNKQIDALPLKKNQRDNLKLELSKDRLQFDKDKWDEKLQLERDKLNKKDKKKPLNQTERVRHDNLELAVEAIKGMDKALASGQLTFYKRFGDNDFTRNRRMWEEAFGRMQSFGAITEREEVRFRDMVPMPGERPHIQQAKLRDMLKMIQQRRGAFKGRADQSEEPFLFYNQSDKQVKILRLKQKIRDKKRRMKEDKDD